MGMILLTHIDENVNVIIRLDKASAPNGSMLELDGILQIHPAGVPDAFVLIPPPGDVMWDLDAKDVVSVRSKAPAGLFDHLVQKALRRQAEVDELTAEAARQRREEASAAEPVIHKP